MQIRNVVAGLALVGGFGCAQVDGILHKDQPKKSEAVTAQDQAQQQFQRAADAQKNAKEEQGKAEQANRDVEKAQRALADAQARGQQMKAQQSQAEAARLAELAQKTGGSAQQNARQAQSAEFDKQSKLQAQRQDWGQTQELNGKFLGASDGGLQVQGMDQKILQLGINDSTAIMMDGKMVPAAQLSPGADVRASYQLVDGKATAVRIEATSNAVKDVKPDDSNQPLLNGQPHQ